MDGLSTASNHIPYFKLTERGEDKEYAGDLHDTIGGIESDRTPPDYPIPGRDLRSTTSTAGCQGGRVWALTATISAAVLK